MLVLLTEVMDDSPDGKLIKQSVVVSNTRSDSDPGSSSDGQGDGRMTAKRIVCRRIVEESRVRFVWEAQVKARGTVLRGMPPMQLTEQGCGQIFESTTVSTTDSRKRTMLQSILSVTPTPNAEPLASSSDAFSEFIVTSFEANVDSARRVIENQLMD